MVQVHTKQLVDHLRRHQADSLAPIQKLKYVYRPIICPFDTLLNLIPEGRRVLDIGCGIGTFLQLVAEYRAPNCIAGIETDGSLVETSQSLLRTVSPNLPSRFAAYNGYDFPDWIQEYNCVLLIDVLHHVPRAQQTAFLSNLIGRLHPDTVFIFKDIDADQPFWCLFNKMHDLVLSRQYTYERGVEELSGTLQQLGCKILKTVKQRLYVYPHYTLVCKKV